LSVYSQPSASYRMLKVRNKKQTAGQVCWELILERSLCNEIDILFM
jgi:hypothetical protein